MKCQFIHVLSTIYRFIPEVNRTAVNSTIPTSLENGEFIAVVHNFVRNALASLVVTPAKAGVQSRGTRD